MSNDQLLDLVFVLDATGSMGPWIRSAENSINNIVKQIHGSKKLASPSALRVGVLAYRDVESENFVEFLTKPCPLTSNIDEVHKFLKYLGATGGGDGPEAVATALDVTINDANIMGWLPSSKGAHQIIVHITDAPPHGLEDGDPKNPTKDAKTAGIFKNIIRTNEIMKKNNFTYFVVSCGEMGKIYKWAVPFYRRATSGNGYMLPLVRADLLPNAITALALESLALDTALEEMREELKKLNVGERPSFANDETLPKDRPTFDALLHTVVAPATTEAPKHRQSTTTEASMTPEKAIKIIHKICEAKGIKVPTLKTNISYNFTGNALHNWNIMEKAKTHEDIVGGLPTPEGIPITGSGEQAVEIVYEPISIAQVERMAYRYKAKYIDLQSNYPAEKLEAATFNTMEIRPWQNPQAHNVGTIQLKLPNCSPPNVLLGVNSLDMNILRIKSHILEVTNNKVKVDLESWGDTVQYSAGVSLLSIPKSDTDIQFGRFNTMDDHAWTQPKLSTTRRITFTRAYSAPPKVVVWLESGDTGAAQNCRIITKAEDITTSGFTIHIDTWSDTKVWSGGASWIAYSANRNDIRSGTFGTNDIRVWSNPQLENSARISFSGGPLSKTPQVFAALNMLDIQCGRNIRVKLRVTDVSSGGLTWHLDSWYDTIQYAAGGSYIAFDQ
ncbi:hypothetical protein PQX77_015937 [Marasmius sp. AFHP31]|nr:hypothetical protein PQX77_015937 [Marasmius sp. AFHP31]